ncbi:MAG TPA: bifunctional UDP-N-acetylglucosamine diphosphorylase/glucosamine-1-phosphate N-acetyltransferase GlmU [Mycobacteriales bacterium]|nr:bifunctional UDP-N-acetylglucosamine diphosphorylase/glucosamine-1-phosphate N-acetyltransferase GlmU [Mycobacteriales bacterium]
MTKPSAVVILAAGQGTRMRSATAKVLHSVCGRTLLGHLLGATAGLGADRTLVVVGHEREAVTAEAGRTAPEATCVVQEQQRGTGDAVRRALAAAPDLAGTVVVVPGDTPLLTTQSLQILVTAHAERGAAATLLTARVPDPTGYGRVLRDEPGDVVRVVEHKDASPDQLAVDEVNTSIYAFDAALLRAALDRLTTDNAQGEEYLTDVVGLLVGDGRPVGAVTVADWRDVGGVNDRAQLAEAGARLRDRVILEAMLAGVTVVDPATTWMDVDVVVEPEALIEPFTLLHGRTVVEAGAVVGPGSRLTDTVVRAGASVVSSTCVGAEIGPRATVGPYTYLRPGTRLGEGAKAGGFVEMKNADIGDGAKVPHLSYVGDAVIGARSNLGAGTITCNYDGQHKHGTTVGEDAFVGSDTMLVAPVTVGDGAFTAAGSAITKDVPDGALGVGRAQQRNIEGWAERRRGGTQSVAEPPDEGAPQ